MGSHRIATSMVLVNCFGILWGTYLRNNSDSGRIVIVHILLLDREAERRVGRLSLSKASAKCRIIEENRGTMTLSGTVSGREDAEYTKHLNADSRRVLLLFVSRRAILRRVTGRTRPHARESVPNGPK